ncbi:protein FAM170A-like [Ochotona curzoniae]|uniref:protein FAM170A-like n=1 Tax=Ochotona curzoniae TaxID=130825 RepID=UPI001B34DEBB|nr:protein FAM170A-like [Ochotona curzoniae]
MKRKQKTKHLEITYPPQSEKTSRGFCTSQADVPETGIHQCLTEAPCLRFSETPLLQFIELQQTLLPYQNNCFHYHLANEPCTPEIHRRKERQMKIYYTRVQRKMQVTDLGNAEKGLTSSPRKTRVQEITFSGKIPVETDLPILSPWDLLTESECGWDVGDEEEMAEVLEEEEPDGPAELPPLEEQPRARPPEWLLTPDSGYKCLGCCRVFPSKDALQWHVQHGVEEGFSCRAFHLAFAWLKSKRSMKNRRQKRSIHSSRKGKRFHRRNSSGK